MIIMKILKIENNKNKIKKNEINNEMNENKKIK